MGYKVLLIEDNALDAKIEKRKIMRTMPDAEVDVVGTLGEGLDKISKVRYDLIVTDLNLPDSNTGTNTVQKLVEAQPSVPVIAVSGDRSDQFDARAMAAGASDYVRKTDPPHALTTAMYHARRGDSDVGLVLARIEHKLDNVNQWIDGSPGTTQEDKQGARFMLTTLWIERSKQEGRTRQMVGAFWGTVAAAFVMVATWAAKMVSDG